DPYLHRRPAVTGAGVDDRADAAFLDLYFERLTFMQFGRCGHAVAGELQFHNNPRPKIRGANPFGFAADVETENHQHEQRDEDPDHDSTAATRLRCVLARRWRKS